jgi:hypothetical protein
VVDWFTKPLTAFTLSSAVLLNIRGTINSPSNASWRFEIARVANDGSSPTVWGANSIINSPIGSEAAQQFYISGDDLAITAGQRLRLRAYIAPNQDVMVTGKILTLFYAGTSGGASGDTYLIFGETLTENANTVSGSFTADAILRVPGAASFTADAVIAAVTPPVVGTTVVIRLGGVDVTSHVIFADAEFTQQANGQPGSARLRLRDLGHTLSPTAGQTLTVDVNGLRVWGGWALRVSPGYFFAVDDTSNPAQTERVWILEGVDYNILFSKRFLINRLNPTQMLPIYPKDTPDFQVVLDVVQRFLELNNDGISTSGVTHVGTPNLDGDFSAGNPGDSWGTSMNLIAGPTAAVFYIDPNKVLQFVDVETATAPFALSDHPDHTTSFGYRDMEITNDGTKLVNDMMVWGAGAHSTPDTRFVRVQDATSIATHGRWQQGEFTSALFTTSGVTQRAESFVYGTPQSKRGGKDDAIQISCVTYHPGLTAGQIINFSSTVFGYSDTLPIRRLGIRFPNPTSVEFRVFLSYDIDAPWSDYEFWFPRINFQPPTGGGIGGIVWPPIVLPPVTDCSDDVCGITDTFTRTVAETIHTGSSGATVADIGTSDAGRHWGNPTGTLFGLGALLGNGNIGVSVNGSSLLVRGWATALGVPPGSMSMVIPDTGSFTPLAVDHTATKSVTFSMDSLPGHAGNNTVADIYFDVGGGVLNNDPFIWINAMPTSYPIGTFFQSQLSFGPTSAPIAQTLIPNSWWQAGVTYTFTVRDNGTDTIATISDGTTTYTSTHSGFTSDNLPTAGLVVNYETGLGGVSAAEQVIMTFDNFNVPEITRCSQNEFDNFNRIVASGWGTATPSGAVWTLSSLNVSTSVGGAYGVVTMTGAIGGDFARFETTVPTGMTGSFEEVVGFFVSRVSSAADSDQSLILNLGYDQEVILRIGNSTGGFVPGGIVVGSTYAAKTDWTTDPYFLRMSWNADTGEIKARVWLQSDPEPTSWLVTAITSPGSLASVKVEADPLAVSDSIFLDSIDFDYDGKPCYPAGPPPEPGPAVGGVICQQFVGGVHQYTVSQAYTPGTTKVYVDGTFQGLNVEYSETDPTNGIIYFGVAPAPPATVTVCFTATVG